MSPYSWTHVGTPSHLGHMDRVAATMPSQAHAGAAQEAPNKGQWEGQGVPLVRPSSCIVKRGIPSSWRYLPTYLEVLERRWRGPGPKDAYGRRGEREARCCSWGEGNMDMGRQWQAFRRPGERGRRWRGLGVEDACGQRGKREARCCSGGVGDANMGQRWRAWRRPGGRERQQRSPGGSRGASRSKSGANERLRRGGAVGCVRAGVGAWRGWGAGAPQFAGPGLVAGRVAPVWRHRRGLGGLRWCRLVLVGGRPPHSVDLPRRGAAAVAAGGMGRLTGPGSGWPGRPLRRGRGG